MKTARCPAILLAFLAIWLAGCSDTAQSPVTPSDQSAQAPASLVKSNNVDFSFTSSPIWVDPNAPNYVKVAGRTVHMKNVQVVDRSLSAEKRIEGRMEHLLSLMLDVVTGEGPCHGSFTLIPDPAFTGGGVWEGTYEGFRSKTAAPYVFALPLKLVAHGKGGTIDKMLAFMSAELTVYTDLEHWPLPTYWTATGTGYIKEH